MSPKSLISAIATLALTLAGPALAFIPPSGFILKTLAGKHAGAKVLKIRSTVTALESDKPTGVHFREVTVFNSVTRVMRSWAFDDASKQLYSFERKVEVFPAVDEVLLDSNTKALTQALKSAGVSFSPEEEVSDKARKEDEQTIARWNETVAWVIGAHKSNQSSPQLWVEKDTFLPLRLRTDNEVRFENYRFFHEFPYPRAITLATKSGSGLLKDEVNDVTVNPESNEMRGNVTTGFTDAGNSSPSVLRDLIRQYYEAVR